MSEVAPVIYLLAGVTAAGKSEFSLKWAEQMGGEILSCDSIAIYRGMDILVQPNLVLMTGIEFVITGSIL